MPVLPRFASLALCLALFAAGFASQATQAKTLAKAGEVEITDEDVRIANDDLAASLPQQLEGAAKETYLIDYLIDLALVAKSAEKQKLAESTDFARRMAYFREKVLMEYLLASTTKGSVTDEAMKKVYDDAAGAKKGDMEVRARMDGLWSSSVPFTKQPSAGTAGATRSRLTKPKSQTIANRGTLGS